MSKTKPPAAPQGNRLLARLPPEEYQSPPPPLASRPAGVEARPLRGSVAHRLRLLPEPRCRLGSDRDGRRQGHRGSDDRGRGHGGPAAPRRGQNNGQPDDRAGSRRGHADGRGRAAGRGQPGQPLAPVAGPLPHRLSGPGFAGGGLQRPALGSPALLPLAVDDPGPGALGRVPDDARVPGRDARRAAFHRLRGSRTLPGGRLDPLQPGEMHRPRPGGPEGRFLRVLPGDRTRNSSACSVEHEGMAEESLCNVAEFRNVHSMKRACPVCRRAYRRIRKQAITRRNMVRWQTERRVSPPTNRLSESVTVASPGEKIGEV